MSIVALNIALQFTTLRLDLTEDKRYTLAPETKHLLRTLAQQSPETVKATLILDGDLNSGFLRLRQHTEQMLREMSRYASIDIQTLDPLELPQEELSILHQQLMKAGYHPTQIYERQSKGQAQQTLVYPFLILDNDSSSTLVPLLQNNPTLSGTDNLNHSVEALEYQLTMGLQQMLSPERQKIGFIEGHGEFGETDTYDLQQTLSRYFDIYYGSISHDIHCLDDFCCIIIAGSKQPFTEAEKYVIDQYVMRGGRVLWAIDGVRFSEDILSKQGFTPVMPLDLNLQDLLFRHGVRINPDLVTDMQCVTIPVDISIDPLQPQYVPMPWTYSPLLLTSAESPITKDLMQVNATFCSTVDFVGSGENQQRSVLLASSNASHIIATPAEVNLEEVETDEQYYHDQFIPVAVALDGQFTSLFQHRAIPKEIITDTEKLTEGQSKQIYIACSSAIANDWQQGTPLPIGYDRYQKIQWGNRDFFLNSVLALTDDYGLLSLRQKHVRLRLLNEKAVRSQLTKTQALSLVVPLGLLCLMALIINTQRKYKNRKTNYA